MTYYTSANISHFITYELWLEALKLLEFQVAQKKHNKHYNTLSMFYYETISSEIEQLKDLLYFQSRVANDLFYGLEKEFEIFTYLTPKPALGLRSYKFFSYPLRAIYYTMGLYLLRLTQDYLDEFKPRYPQIKSYYGGQLRFEKESLIVNANNTFYKRSYKAFRKQIKEEICGETFNKVVLQLDIKDYFDEISIPILLNLLSTYVKSSVQAQFSFDATTIDQITFFFQYLNSGRNGIPQTENDIIGGFIGYLYLTFADFAINSEILRESNLIKNHSIIRYVDDVYVILDFEDDVLQYQREDFIDSLSARIADMLYYRLGLKLNTKSRLYWLNESVDVEALLRNLRKVSSFYQYSDTDKDDKPKEKINDIFFELEKIKRSRMGTYFILESSVQDEILKEVFDPVVDQLLHKRENVRRLEWIFDGFNFDFVKVSPFEITIIMLHSQQIKEKYKQFLLNKKYIPTDDVDLIIKFLSQTDFKDHELLEKLKQNAYMKNIISLILSGSAMTLLPGYYHIVHSKIRSVVDKSHVIEQIRLRAMAQKLELYSVALNHLLNEIHAICLLKDLTTRKSPKDYDANDVRDFLVAQNVPYDICVHIRNLFDRRNTNQVSHPGSLRTVTWGVSREEYFQYHSWVGQCLAVIL